MVLWYNDPKEGKNIGTIRGSFEGVSAQIEIEEGRVIKNGTNYHLVFVSERMNQVNKYGDPDFEGRGVIAEICFHSTEYEKGVKQDDGSFSRVKQQPSDLELAICKEFESNSSFFQNNIYAFTGSFNILDSGTMINALLQGKSFRMGKMVELSPEQIDIFRDQLHSLSPIPIVKLTDDFCKELTEANNKSYSGKKGYTPKSETQKSEERLAFLQQVFAETQFTGEDPLTVLGLTELIENLGKNRGEAYVQALLSVLSLLLK